MIKMKVSTWVVAQCPYCSATKRISQVNQEVYCYCDEVKTYSSEFKLKIKED